jgi:hypothetical protein
MTVAKARLPVGRRETIAPGWKELRYDDGVE